MSKRIINTGLIELQTAINNLEKIDCNWVSCKRTPENNQIDIFTTCERCKSIIHLNRAKKQFLKIQKRMI